MLNNDVDLENAFPLTRLSVIAFALVSNSFDDRLIKTKLHVIDIFTCRQYV